MANFVLPKTDGRTDEQAMEVDRVYLRLAAAQAGELSFTARGGRDVYFIEDSFTTAAERGRHANHTFTNGVTVRAAMEGAASNGITIEFIRDQTVARAYAQGQKVGFEITTNSTNKRHIEVYYQASTENGATIATIQDLLDAAAAHDEIGDIVSFAGNGATTLTNALSRVLGGGRDDVTGAHVTITDMGENLFVFDLGTKISKFNVTVDNTLELSFGTTSDPTMIDPTALTIQNADTAKFRFGDLGTELTLQQFSDLAMGASITNPYTVVATSSVPTANPPKNVLITDDDTYTFKAGDFGFMDDDTADRLHSITITSLPTEGALQLVTKVTQPDNTIRVDVDATLTNENLATMGTILRANIGKLRYVQPDPPPKENGDPGDPVPTGTLAVDAEVTFTYTVSDGTNDSAPATLTIEANKSPVFTSGATGFRILGGGDDGTTVGINSPFSTVPDNYAVYYHAMATDPDGDAFTYSIPETGNSSFFTITADGVVFLKSLTSIPSPGDHPIIVIATDSHDEETRQTVNIQAVAASKLLTINHTATDNTAELVEQVAGDGTTEIAKVVFVGTVTYSLDAVSTALGFAINADTGSITYGGSGLNFEDGAMRTLVVTGKNATETKITSYGVLVTVINLDNSDPVIDVENITTGADVSVADLTGTGTSATATAKTADGTADALITWSTTASERVLTITGQVQVDSTNAIGRGNNGQFRGGADDADFLTAHGLMADDEWWVYGGEYGTLVIKADGTYSYVLDATDADVTALTEPPTAEAVAVDRYFVNLLDANSNDYFVSLRVPIYFAGKIPTTTPTGIQIQTLTEVSAADSFHVFAIDENTTPSGALFTVPVRDDDNPSEGTPTETITYTLDGATNAAGEDISGDFMISQTTGAVSLATGAVFTFNHEENAYLRFSITASVVSSLPTIAGMANSRREAQTLTIEAVLLINNVNEDPEFATKTATATGLRDGVPVPADKVVYTAEATDPDQEATFTYGLKAGDDAALFNIDANTGAVTFKAATTPMLATKDMYTFTVTASDGDPTSLTAQQLVTINVVTNLDENGPVFDAALSTSDSNVSAAQATDVPADVTVTGADASAFYYAVNENTTPSGALLTILAADADVVDTITYALTKAVDAAGADVSGDFAIAEDTGAISLASGAMLDHEATAYVLFEITATSTSTLNGASGSPRAPQTATQQVILIINDVGEDFGFTSDSITTGEIPEDTDGSTTPITIGTVTANDPDADAANVNVTYSLDDASETAGFMIDAMTGAITYEGAAIDFETTPEADRTFTLTVTATPEGGTAITHTVQVTVTDETESPIASEVDNNIAFNAGDVFVFTRRQLDSSNPENPDAVLEYTLKAAITEGGAAAVLQTRTDANADWVALAANGTFTQAQVDAGNVRLSGASEGGSFMLDLPNTKTATINFLVREATTATGTDIGGTETLNLNEGAGAETPRTIEAGVGDTTITPGSGDDEIDPGLGDDVVDLTAGGDDIVIYRYGTSGGNTVAWGGGDRITGFEPGKDQLHLADVSGASGDFLAGLGSGFIATISTAYDTAAAGDRSQIASYDVTGIEFHFSQAVVLPGGVLGGSILSIEFDTDIPWADFSRDWLNDGAAFNTGSLTFKNDNAGKAALMRILGLDDAGVDALRSVAIGDGEVNAIDLTGESGGWVVFGGGGDDRITLDAGTEEVVYRLAVGDSAITAPDGNDMVRGFDLGTDSLTFVDTDGTPPAATADASAVDVLMAAFASVSLEFDGADYTGITFGINGTDTLQITFAQTLDQTDLITAFGSPITNANLQTVFEGDSVPTQGSSASAAISNAGRTIIDALFGDEIGVVDSLPPELV